MSFNQSVYINEYNKEKYKIYQFRVKRTDEELIEKLDNLENRNKYIVDAIKEYAKTHVYTIKQIKDIIKPILNKHDIYDIYLFGSYARGEAKSESDVDIYCEPGSIKSLLHDAALINELEDALNKKVDVIYTTTTVNKYFKEQMMEDMIKLC